MTYAYRILPTGLHITADAAISWFVQKWGIKRSGIVVEGQFYPDIPLRPTFYAKLDDGHILVVEVAEKIYDNTLDAVCLECRNKGLPVKLFVAVPKGVSDINYAKRLKDAKRAGVGILEVDNNSGELIQQALSLSLAGVRYIDTSEFPARFRQSLQNAHQTFRDGEPSKACSLIYDELEACFRLFAKKCVKKRLWANPSNLDIEKVAWVTLLQNIDKYLDRSDAQVRDITSLLIARMIGVTPHRNESGHKPSTLKARMKRDGELRTRFEAAVDLFTDFLGATKTLRL